jgi:hypothetical protein
VRSRRHSCLDTPAAAVRTFLLYTRHMVHVQAVGSLVHLHSLCCIQQVLLNRAGPASRVFSAAVIVPLACVCCRSGAAAGPQAHEFSVFWVPRRSIAVEKVLEDEGVYGSLTQVRQLPHVSKTQTMRAHTCMLNDGQSVLERTWLLCALLRILGAVLASLCTHLHNIIATLILGCR